MKFFTIALVGTALLLVSAATASGVDKDDKFSHIIGTKTLNITKPELEVTEPEIDFKKPEVDFEEPLIDFQVGFMPLWMTHVMSTCIVATSLVCVRYQDVTHHRSSASRASSGARPIQE
jgi:hypothetical protein